MNKRLILILGDLLTFAIITLIGFSEHSEVGVSYLPRMAAVYIPMAILWFLISPLIGLFRNEIIQNPRQLWRPVPVMIITGPLTALSRGLILNSPIIPIFVGVLTITLAVGMLIWRVVYYFITQMIV